MGGFRWMSVGRSVGSVGWLAASGWMCAVPQLSFAFSVCRVVYVVVARSRSEKRGNVGARDSEWKKSAPIRGNK